MNFVATHWYIWLIVMIVGYGYALFNQLHRIKRLGEDFNDSGKLNVFSLEEDFRKSKDLFFKGFGKMVVSGLIGSCGLVLLIIATIMNIIIAVKQP